MTSVSSSARKAPIVHATIVQLSEMAKASSAGIAAAIHTPAYGMKRSSTPSSPHSIAFDPPVDAHDYRDAFDNVCTRIRAPAGRLTVATDFIVNDAGLPDTVAPDAPQVPVERLPDDVLIYLLGSRYCETDRLMDFAWSRFGPVVPGWARVQAVCDFAHGHVVFDYEAADPTRTAIGALEDGIGVCRDFTHLAVALCRCLNIPARYCTGYLGDIGIPPQPYPMDFSAWFEVWLGQRWHAFDARHNMPRIGRIPIAHGLDAADVPITMAFGAHKLARFEVTTQALPAQAEAA